jgi:hypothetical protein
MERAAQIARRNNYPFLQPKHLELLVKVNMTSRIKYGWSALQNAFTAPKFSTTTRDALKVEYTSGEMADLQFFSVYGPAQLV